jgi:hypothetical protein
MLFLRLVAVLILFRVITVDCWSADATNKEFRPVSIFRVIADPEKFEGQNIALEGFTNIARDNTAIFATPESRNFALASHAIWLNVIGLSKESATLLHNRCCRIKGTFHNNPANVPDGFNGRIDVIEVEVIHEDYVERRDFLLRQLGYVEKTLLNKKKTLSPSEIVDLEREQKEIQQMIQHLEETR